MIELNKIIHADCMDVMKDIPDNYFELAIVDPPYGIKRFMATDGGNSKKITCFGNNASNWNNIKPDNKYFDELFRVSKNQIIWGANNFNLPLSEYFIIWQKSNALDFSFAMVEQAWTNIKKPAKIYVYLHSQNPEIRFHPTQKPVALYKWLLHNYAKPNDKILDTHSGSGTTAMTCIDMGFDYLCIEKDKDYYEASLKRIDKENIKLKLAI